MTIEQLENVNVSGMEEMPTPEAVMARVPLSPQAAETVSRGRATVRRIIDGSDPRLLLIVGPCSIHDTGQPSITRPWLKTARR